MKTLHKINVWALGITIVFFIIPTFGMLLMIPLGVLQLFSAACMTLFYFKKMDAGCRKLTGFYLLFAAIDLTGIALSYYHDKFTNDLFSVPFLFIFPACIAIYFVYTTYSITKYFNHGNAVPQH